MNLDKTIIELTNRLDIVYTYSTSSINHQNRNDGINYWKGKKIISTKDWNDLYKKYFHYFINIKTENIIECVNKYTVYNLKLISNCY